MKGKGSKDVTQVSTYPLQERRNKVRAEDFARAGAAQLWDRIPDILVGREFKAFAAALHTAREAHGTMLWMMGAHVIKCGLGPLLIDLMERGFVSHLATNGAAPIHDLELALIGETSEEVAEALRDGSFGMARETGEIMNRLINSAEPEGLGESYGRGILVGAFPHRRLSVFAAAARLGISTTVHSAIGTEIIQMHPSFRFEAQSRKTYEDFLRLVGRVRGLTADSVVINLGSGVMMPEVFLRSLNLARNLDRGATGFTTANFDMERRFRPYENIVRRPTQGGGRGYYFVGQHELMLPLLHWLLTAEDGGPARGG